MCLYEEDRVKQLEDTNEFQELLEKSKQRKISAQQGVETKFEKADQYLEKALDELKIEFDLDATLSELEREAENVFNDWQDSRPSVQNGNGEPREWNGDITNYVRHNYTNYDDLYQKYYGKVGMQGVHDELKVQINEKINDSIQILPKNKKELYTRLYSNLTTDELNLVEQNLKSMESELIELQKERGKLNEQASIIPSKNQRKLFKNEKITPLFEKEYKLMNEIKTGKLKLKYSKKKNQ